MTTKSLPRIVAVYRHTYSQRFQLCSVSDGRDCDSDSAGFTFKPFHLSLALRLLIFSQQSVSHRPGLYFSTRILSFSSCVSDDRDCDNTSTLFILKYPLRLSIFKFKQRRAPTDRVPLLKHKY
ncbi:hypothetical protein DPMN_017289 [Dreissena polymorpha]|uniref:Uncharacterized protein n=1 Tax=Dreissena polymorpha TaxID=45954 RepID=A0A9D4S769_DREPO|nr:hypothetical protein DPMN_017289 [Dreissena polymorpha]